MKRIFEFGFAAVFMLACYLSFMSYLAGPSVASHDDLINRRGIERVGDTNAYWVALGAISRVGKPDTSHNPDRSELLLYEDGVLLGPAHTPHIEIQNIGKGRYSHWFTGFMIVMFSASDNSDPRVNGRVYRIVDPSVGP